MPQSPFNPWLPVWAHNCSGQISWDSWDNADSFHIPHCCRMSYSVSSPLQAQPILAAGCPLVATSDDSCLSPVLLLYKSLTEVKWVTAFRSTCFCWPFGAAGNHCSHTESWRKTLFLLLTATTTHRQRFMLTLEIPPEGKRGWNCVEQVKSCIKSCHTFSTRAWALVLSARSRMQLCWWAKGSRLCKPGCHPSWRIQELKIALYLWLLRYSFRASNLYATCTIW